MSAPIPSIEPTNFAAGETLLWTKAIADYASTDGWTLTYYLVGPTAVTPIAATPNADGTFSMTVPATSTAPLLKGTYNWEARVSKAGEVHVVGRSVFIVTPNLATATTLVSHAAKTLALIEAALEGRVPADMQQYQIAGRQITKIPVLELYGLRSRYQQEVAAERNPTRANPVRSITFVDA